MESLPHDVVELILERLAVKTLVRFKIVSKQWRWTIESSIFQERQLIHRHKSGDPDVVMVSASFDSKKTRIEYLQTLVLGSSSSYVNIPIPYENILYFVCENSCDGLLCLYHFDAHKCSFVLNPATRWCRPVPLSGLQQRRIYMEDNSTDSDYTFPYLGFGKDIINNVYKPVWLYNSHDFGLENATTCEVFDFSTNTWRYVTPTPPYQILPHESPVYINGSLYWLTDSKDMLSFDLHTETFQVIIIPKAPFDIVYDKVVHTCNLDNRFCIYNEESDNNVIWSFDSGNKTWEKLYSKLMGSDEFKPLAILYKNRKKFLLGYRWYAKELVIFDIESKSHGDAVYRDDHLNYPVCYFQSLISIL